MRYFILLAILGATVAVPRIPQRIVGGEATTIDQYPFMANMQIGWYGIFWYHACGATLINNYNLISAAHCYYGDSPSNWKVLLGTSYPFSGGTEYDVSQLTLHPNFNTNTMNNDVAVIRLSSPAAFSDITAPARIAGSSYHLADGTPLTVIGWGILSIAGAIPEQLQRVEINQINQEFCAERYAHLKTLPGFQNWPDITDGMLCAGVDGGGKDSCQGDSGGPVIHNGDIVVGIVSWGYRCGEPDYPGVNARVSHYTDWFLNNL